MLKIIISSLILIINQDDIIKNDDKLIKMFIKPKIRKLSKF